MKRTLSSLLLIILILAPIFGITSTISFINDYDSIENASNSVLRIETDDDFDDEYYTSGSGFVAFNNKTFITNFHVIDNAVQIHVYDEDFREYRVGEILAVDKERDIAIISFKSSTTLRPLTLAVNPDLKRGQPVATIGYPKGLFNTLSTGIISAILDFDDKKEIQFTAPISHGSSGGALFNEDGEVIGITTSLIEDGQNINYAVDVSHAIALYQGIYPNYTPYKASVTTTPRITPKPTIKPTASISPTKKPSPTPTAQAGYSQVTVYDKGQAVLNIQIRLTSLGYFTEVISGVYEKSTFDAVRMFQETSGLPGTGVSDIETQGLLFSEKAIKASTSPKAVLTPSLTPTLTLKLSPSPTPAPVSYITQEDIAKYKPLAVGMNDPAVARLKERVDHSTKVIAVYDGVPGGTKNTIEYAMKCGVGVEYV